MTKFTHSHSANSVVLGIKHICIPITHTAEEIFTSIFGNSTNCYWLDSSQLIPDLSRYSFMGDISSRRSYSASYDTLTQKVSVYYEGEFRKSELQISIFDFLQRSQQNTTLVFDEGLDIPFHGGHVGYFGYELKNLTCGVDSRSSLYPDAYFIYSERFLAFDHENGHLYVVSLYDKNDDTDLYSAERWLDDMTNALASLSTAACGKKLYDHSAIKFSLRHGRSEYIDRINRCLDEIRDGESYEICLTNEITAELNINPLDVYRILRLRNPAPYSAFLRFGELAIACSSPERFLKIDREGLVETKPIKGTAPRSNDSDVDRENGENLRKDEKSRSENLMITDLMRNDLGRVCVSGSVTVPSLMHIESYRTVHQLVSVIAGRLRHDESPLSCIFSCFPGGSMTGAPKRRTLEIIDSLEERARGIYSGAIGYLSLSGTTDLNIVIRTIVCRPNEVSIGCGGAIVALSDPELEFEEILLKARAPMEAIAEAATGNPEAPFSISGSHSVDIGITSHSNGVVQKQNNQQIPEEMAMQKNIIDGLKPYRDRINELDENLIDVLTKRLSVCGEVAHYKKAHGIAMMQPDRVAAVKARCGALASAKGLRAEFATSLYTLIIEEACALEDIIIDGET